MSGESLYDRLGGEAAIDAAVDLFYEKVLADERIAHYFESVDMPTQARKQKAFLTVAFGGPNNYDGRDMNSAHSWMVEQGLKDMHFDAVLENLGRTLVELEVPGELIGEAAVIAESVRDEVLGRSASIKHTQASRRR